MDWCNEVGYVICMFCLLTVVRTATPANLQDSTWAKNGVNRPVSHSFGYGLMDAAAMIKLARNWQTVPEQQRCEINAPPLDRYVLRSF